MSRRIKLLHIVLICALTISIALNMHQFYLLHASAKIDIVGTFAQMDVSPPAVKYFVFLSDGQYVLYQNSTVLDNGVYSVHPEDSKLFELESSKNKKACVVWTAGKQREMQQPFKKSMKIPSLQVLIRDRISILDVLRPITCKR